MSGQRHIPAALFPIPIGKKVRLTPQLDAMANRKIPVPDGNQIPVIQLVARYFTDWDTWADVKNKWLLSFRDIGPQ